MSHTRAWWVLRLKAYKLQRKFGRINVNVINEEFLLFITFQWKASSATCVKKRGLWCLQKVRFGTCRTACAWWKLRTGAHDGSEESPWHRQCDCCRGFAFFWVLKKNMSQSERRHMQFGGAGARKKADGASRLKNYQIQCDFNNVLSTHP